MNCSVALNILFIEETYAWQTYAGIMNISRIFWCGWKHGSYWFSFICKWFKNMLSCLYPGVIFFKCSWSLKSSLISFENVSLSCDPKQKELSFRAKSAIHVSWGEIRYLKRNFRLEENQTVAKICFLKRILRLIQNEIRYLNRNLRCKVKYSCDLKGRHGCWNYFFYNYI